MRSSIFSFFLFHFINVSGQAREYTICLPRNSERNQTLRSQLHEWIHIQALHWSQDINLHLTNTDSANKVKNVLTSFWLQTAHDAISKY